MTPLAFPDLLRIALAGLVATALMDLWLALLRRFGVPTMDLALLGRWVMPALRGRWRHAPIQRSQPMRAERAIGWIAHYAIGIAFAALPPAVDPGWLADPRWTTALAVGLATVAAPWFVMQPALGGGIAFARTRTPAANRLRSLLNHAVFGIGLQAGAVLAARVVTP